MRLSLNLFKLILIYSVVLLTIVVFLPISSTGADSNTPEIKIDTLPESVLFNIKDFKPGDWAPRVLTIQNNGNQDFSYNLQSRMKSGSEKLYNQFQLKIEDQSGIIFEGDLKDFKGLDPRPLTAFSEEKLTLTVEFPYKSGNEFQGLETEVEIVLFAEGKDNQTPPNNEETDGENGNNPPDNKNPPTKGSGSLPQTGEENPILIILSGLFISMAGLALLLVKKSINSNPFKRGRE